jgi:hypothetical protein
VLRPLLAASVLRSWVAAGCTLHKLKHLRHLFNFSHEGAADWLKRKLFSQPRKNVVHNVQLYVGA